LLLWIRRRKREPEPESAQHDLEEPDTAREVLRAPTARTGPMQFGVTSNVDLTRRIALAEVSGDVDVYTSPKLREYLTMLLALEGWDTMVIDLRSISFLDSAGLSVLVGAARRARGLDKDVVLVVTHPRILKVLEISGLTKALLVVDDPAVLE
jgi:anti-sigma B factor antagonist